MIRFGVIGAGRIGKVHAATIAVNPKAKLVYVADAFKASAEALAAQTGAEVADAEEVIKSSSVDAILIATPTPSHADLIEAAAKAGKAILCEKPVSLSVERINACLDVVEKNKSTLMIGFNRRFDPNFASVEARLRHGDIGEIEIVTITSRDPAPPPADYVKSSGGLFRDMMIHDFDMARFLMGEEFVVVNALGSSLVDKAIGAEGDVDTAAVQMQTASGALPLSPIRAGRLMATTSAWKSTELPACLRRGISMQPASSFPMRMVLAAIPSSISSLNATPRPTPTRSMPSLMRSTAATVRRSPAELMASRLRNWRRPPP